MKVKVYGFYCLSTFYGRLVEPTFGRVRCQTGHFPVYSTFKIEEYALNPAILAASGLGDWCENPLTSEEAKGLQL